MKEIRNAIKAFGEKSDNIAIHGTGDVSNVAVYLDGEYYGIYSFSKNTFVD